MRGSPDLRLASRLLFIAVLVALLQPLPVLSAPDETSKCSKQVEATLAEVDRLFEQKKYKQAIVVLDASAKKARSNWKDLELITYKRATCCYLMEDEPGWRRDLDFIASRTTNKNQVLLTKANYILARPGIANIDEARGYLDAVAKNKISTDERRSLHALQYSVAAIKKDYPNMLILGRQAYAEHPDFWTGGRYAEALARSGQYRQARDLFKHSAAMSKDRAATLYGGEWVLFSVGDLEGAIDLGQEVYRLQPDNAEAALFLVDLLQTATLKGLKSQPVEPILHAIRDALCTPAQQQKKYMILSDLALLRKDPLAIQYALKAEGIMHDKTVWEHLGWVYMHNSSYFRAAHWFQKALAVQPQNARICYELAICRARLGNPDTAIALCSRSLALEPNQIDALRLRAALYLVTEKFAQANADVAQLQKLAPEKNFSLDIIRGYGAKFSPDLVHYYRNTSLSWEQIDNRKLSQLTDQILAEKNVHKRASLWQEKARLEILTRDFQKARIAAEQSIALGNRQYRVYALLAAALYGLHKPTEAKAARQVAVETHHLQLSGNNNQGRSQ